jgi:hypothetical protein
MLDVLGSVCCAPSVPVAVRFCVCSCSSHCYCPPLEASQDLPLVSASQ